MVIRVGCVRTIVRKKCTLIPGRFNGHVDVAVKCWVHCLMEHIQGFIGSHWMLLSDKCLCRIAPVAAMVLTVVKTKTC